MTEPAPPMLVEDYVDRVVRIRHLSGLETVGRVISYALTYTMTPIQVELVLHDDRRARRVAVPWASIAWMGLDDAPTSIVDRETTPGRAPQAFVPFAPPAPPSGFVPPVHRFAVGDRVRRALTTEDLPPGHAVALTPGTVIEVRSDGSCVVGWDPDARGCGATTTDHQDDLMPAGEPSPTRG